MTLTDLKSLPQRRFNRDEYYAMVEAGILRHDEHVELLEGIIFEKFGEGPRSFTADEVHAMVDAGILDEDERVELIKGKLMLMSPIGSPHAASVDRLNRLFSHQPGERAIVRIQNPIHLADGSEPEPDVALLAPRDDFYEEAHPQADDVLLVVEVARSSHARDVEVKLPLYAEHGVREAWLVIPEEKYIKIHRRPVDGGYEDTRRYERGESVTPAAFPDVALPVGDIVGTR